MSTGAKIGIAIGVVFGGVVVLGILASMLWPALARAKAKANRVKCVNNIGNVFKAGLAFAQSNDGRLPWQLSTSTSTPKILLFLASK